MMSENPDSHGIRPFSLNNITGQHIWHNTKSRSQNRRGLDVKLQFQTQMRDTMLDNIQNQMSSVRQQNLVQGYHQPHQITPNLFTQDVLDRIRTNFNSEFNLNQLPKEQQQQAQRYVSELLAETIQHYMTVPDAFYNENMEYDVELINTVIVGDIKQRYDGRLRKCKYLKWQSFIVKIFRRADRHAQTAN
jgi:hypothetical protein